MSRIIIKTMEIIPFAEIDVEGLNRLPEPHPFHRRNFVFEVDGKLFRLSRHDGPHKIYRHLSANFNMLYREGNEPIQDMQERVSKFAEPILLKLVHRGLNDLLILPMEILKEISRYLNRKETFFIE